MSPCGGGAFGVGGASDVWEIRVAADKVELQAADPEDVSGHVEGQPRPRVQAEACVDPSVDTEVQSHIRQDRGGGCRRDAKGKMMPVDHRCEAQERLDPVGFAAAVRGGRRAWEGTQAGVKACKGPSGAVSGR